MRITRHQLSRIIREELALTPPGDDFADPGGHPERPLPPVPQKLKVGDIVRKVDYRGDGWGGDYEKTVGDEVGTIIDVDASEDGPIQYVINWPSGEPTMASADELEIINESAMKITKRQLRRIIKEEKQSLIREGSLDSQRRLLQLAKKIQTMATDSKQSPSMVLQPIDEAVTELIHELWAYFDNEVGL